MAFALTKNVAGRVPDMIEHIEAGAALIATPTNIVDGRLVALDETNNVWVDAVTGGPVGGIVKATYGGTSFPNDAQGNPQGVATFPGGVGKLPVLPIIDTFEVQADLLTQEAVAGDLAPGDLIDIQSPLGLSAIASVNDDFRVTRIIETDSTGKATKVGGRFLNTDYHK